MTSSKSNPKTARPPETLRAMAERNSSFDIDLYRCEPMDSEILGNDTTIAHLTNGTQVMIQMLKNGPISLMNYRYFKLNIEGRKLPWLNGQSIYLPDGYNFKPCSYIPLGDDTIHGRDLASAVTFRKSKGGLCKLRVWGIVEVPLFIGGIPLRIQTLLVDHLPIHRTDTRTYMPNMLVLANLFDKWRIPLYFHSKIMEYRPDSRAIINTCMMSETGNIALEVYADLASSSGHKRGKEYDYGYGIWFAKNSVYNVAGSLISISPTATDLLQLRGALQAVYRIRNMCMNTFTVLDFTDVIVYCSSEYIIKWVPEWIAHCDTKGWVTSLKMDEKAKKLWQDIINTQKVTKRTFYWRYIDKEDNENATSLAVSGSVGLNGENYQILTNEKRHQHEMKELLKPDQRPGKFFESMSLEGGMCRSIPPKGFHVTTCCPCGDTNSSWETNVHF